MKYGRMHCTTVVYFIIFNNVKHFCAVLTMRAEIDEKQNPSRKYYMIFNMIKVDAG